MNSTQALYKIYSEFEIIQFYNLLSESEEMRLKSAIRTMLLVILLLAGGGAWYIWNGMQPVEPAGPDVTFTIEKGMGTAEIADLLKQHGIIRIVLCSKDI